MTQAEALLRCVFRSLDQADSGYVSAALLLRCLGQDQEVEVEVEGQRHGGDGKRQEVIKDGMTRQGGPSRAETGQASQRMERQGNNREEGGGASREQTCLRGSTGYQHGYSRRYEALEDEANDVDYRYDEEDYDEIRDRIIAEEEEVVEVGDVNAAHEEKDKVSYRNPRRIGQSSSHDSDTHRNDNTDNSRDYRNEKKDTGSEFNRSETNLPHTDTEEDSLPRIVCVSMRPVLFCRLIRELKIAIEKGKTARLHTSWQSRSRSSTEVGKKIEKGREVERGREEDEVEVKLTWGEVRKPGRVSVTYSSYSSLSTMLCDISHSSVSRYTVLRYTSLHYPTLLCITFITTIIRTSKNQYKLSIAQFRTTDEIVLILIVSDGNRHYF